MVETIKSTYDFIKCALPIRIGVLATEDAERLCMKNNLSFCDLIKPFSILTNEAQIQGPGTQSYRLYNLHIHAIDVKNAASETTTASREAIAAQINDFGAEDKVSTVTVQVGDHTLSVNRTCPWMDLYRNFVLRSGPPQTHEYLAHLVACMLVVSSSHPNPLQAFSDISQQQNKIQHGDSGKSSLKWMTPNTMKFYVLLHDVKEGDIVKAKEVFQSLQLMFGQNFVYLLQINSRESSSSDSDADIPAPWRQMKNLSTRIDGKQSSTINNHSGTESSITSAMLGCCLNIEDHSALRNFMQDFILRALLPHLEKTIRNINEQLSTRKGLHKSLFKATKAIFGSSKNSSPSTTGGYHTDSNELLVRKAADLCFFSQMYDQALHLYHGAKKDYMNDQAWLHAAGASEMAAVSNFMMRSSKQSYPIQYMEYAINSYLDVCRKEQLALRCTLLHVECLQQVGMFQEAAFHLVRMTNEKDDLRSALLLEQAAYCYLKMQNPQPKKFSFQLVLAGHRYGKCGQKSHAVRCYEMAAQVYCDKMWRLIHDHLDYAVGRLHSSTQNYTDAMDYFRKILIRQSSLADVQQVFVLREFGKVWHKCKATENGKKFANLLLPQLVLDETSVIVGSNSDEIAKSRLILTPTSEIRKVEDQFFKQRMLPKSQLVSSAVVNLSKLTKNATGHQISIGELALIEVSCNNHLGIPIVLHDIGLQFDVHNSEAADCDPLYDCTNIEYITIKANEKLVLKFTFEPLATGKFTAKSISYKLGCHLAGEPSTDDFDRPLQVVDCQPLHIKGKRLNGTREEKFGVFYATDRRLNIQSLVGLPKVKATFQDFPSSLICDQVKETMLAVTNTGKYPISSVEFAVGGSVTITPKETKGESQERNSLVFYSLLDGVVSPGETEKYSLLVKGPRASGHYTLNMVIFCKSDELPSSSYRSYLLQQQLSCSDGMNIGMGLFNAVNERNSVISACVESVDHNTENFSFKDITLSMGSMVEPIGRVKASAVPISTKLHKYFKLQKKNVSDSKILQNNQPFAHVEWNYKDSVHSEPVNGQQTVSVNCIDFVGNGSDLTCAETLKYLHHTILWRLSADRVRYHDFSANPFCVVDCELIAANISKFKLSVSISATKPVAAAGFSWVGMSKVNRTIEPNNKSTVLLKACFTKPGIYNFGGIVVSAIPVNLLTEVPIPQKPLGSYAITVTDSKPRTD